MKVGRALKPILSPVFIGCLLSLLQFPGLKLTAKTAMQRQHNSNNERNPQKWTTLPQLNSQIPDKLAPDPGMKHQWGLKKIDSEGAWMLNQGHQGIVVAVVDTGIDVNHPDLKKNLWHNPGESGIDSKGLNKQTNGIDDDQNGYVDDVHGWNFAQHNNDINDTHGHGTHIAGIIGAERGNGIGVSGVAPKVSLMILKYYGTELGQNNTLINTIKSIHYARQMGAHVINYSGGGESFSFEEQQAIAKAGQNNILFVAAAGNEWSNSDTRPYYPADYNLDNIVSVTATNSRGDLLEASNWGLKTVDLAAPGKSIYSTILGGKYGKMSGTSQATAFVSGTAALIMAENPDLRKPADVIRQITMSGNKDNKLKGKTKYTKRLNSHRALVMKPHGTSATGARTLNTKHQVFYSSTDSSTEDSGQGNSPFASDISGLSDFAQELKHFLDNQGSRGKPDQNVP